MAARTSLLMHKSGSRTIHAVSGVLPPDTAFVSASLHNPGIRPDEPFSGVGLSVQERVPHR